VTPDLILRSVADWAIRATLVAGITGLILSVLRVRTPRVRHSIWASVVVLFLLLPLLRTWGPAFSVPVLDQSSPVPVVIAVLAQPNALSHAAAHSPAPSFWFRIVAGIYFSVAGFLLLRLIVGTILARRLVREAVRCEQCVVSSRCVSPVTVGWLRPVILLPANWREWPAAKLRAVLRHEAEHARWRDPLAQWLALFNRAVFWFHPLAWWLERRLNRLAEEACDDAVLAGGSDARDYADYLIEFARSVRNSGARLSVAGMTMPGNMLSKRLRQLPSLRRHRIAPWRVASAALLSGTAALIAVAAVPERLAALPLALRAIAVPQIALSPAAQEPARRARAIRRTPEAVNADRIIYVDPASFSEEERASAMASTRKLVEEATNTGSSLALLVRVGDQVKAVRSADAIWNYSSPEGGDFLAGVRQAATGLAPSSTNRQMLWVVGRSIVAPADRHTQMNAQLFGLHERGVDVLVSVVSADPVSYP
jgi:beta-lactamase regulating signal transducer with metallopeptidase domain